MVGGNDRATLDPGVLSTMPGEPEIDHEEGLEDASRNDVERTVYTVFPREVVVGVELRVGHRFRYTVGAATLQATVPLTRGDQICQQAD
ncbi:MAG: hypothetical protein IPK93_09420 [Solirubrobacterales bacterium]|nr:hypothetical protein [Solirubrobacterales bacterium]